VLQRCKRSRESTRPPFCDSPSLGPHQRVVCVSACVRACGSEAAMSATVQIPPSGRRDGAEPSVDAEPISAYFETNWKVFIFHLQSDQRPFLNRVVSGFHHELPRSAPWHIQRPLCPVASAILSVVTSAICRTKSQLLVRGVPSAWRLLSPLSTRSVAMVTVATRPRHALQLGDCICIAITLANQLAGPITLG